jgi:hypothetical protein
MDLILLFIPSTAPLDTRSLVQGKIPLRWDRNIHKTGAARNTRAT